MNKRIFAASFAVVSVYYRVNKCLEDRFHTILWVVDSANFLACRYLIVFFNKFVCICYLSIKCPPKILCIYLIS